MQALIQTAYGEPKDVLKLQTVPEPAFDEASEGKLLLRVKAASVNPIDCLIIRGGLKIAWTDEMPASVGMDVSGMVVKAGKGTGFEEGDEVYGFSNMQERGTIAEYCIVSANEFALKPKSLSHDEAASLPIAGLTALQALQVHTGPKDTAFIPGGLGGVGSMALQLAKPYAGFKRVITSVSTAKVQAVKDHVKDVDEVIDYKTVDPATVIPAHSCDFVLDQFGKPASYVRFIKKNGKGDDKSSIVSIMTPPNAEKAAAGWAVKVPIHMRVVLNTMDLWQRVWIPGCVRYDAFFALPNAGDLKILAGLVDEGKVKPLVGKVYSLDQALEAFAHAESQPAGKVVIHISD